MRDRFVCWASNFLLNHVATEGYRVRIDFIISLGIREYIKILRDREKFFDA